MSGGVEEMHYDEARINNIARNGNDGLHYNYEEVKSNDKARALNASLMGQKKDHVKELIDAHWAYIEGVLSPHMTIEHLNDIKYHYKTAFAHGWRHAKEYYTGSV